MKIRRIFSGLYSQLAGQFEASGQIQHRGGRGAHRESALREFLAAHLPRRYSCGTGTLISTTGQFSRQCDIVIHDAYWQPRLLKSDEHALFAADAVFGIIESKSTLSSDELRKAYENIASAKKSANRGRDAFFGGVAAFTADRTLDAIAKQVAHLTHELKVTRSNLLPDIIAVLDQGLVEPLNTDGSVRVLRSGPNTLLHFFLRTLNALNQIDLQPVDFSKYLSLPTTVDGLVVDGHDRFIGTTEDGETCLLRLRNSTVHRIYDTCQAAGEQRLITDTELERVRKETWLGMLAVSTGFVFNPLDKKILSPEQVRQWVSGQAIVRSDELYPQEYIRINGEQYYLDTDALEDTDFELVTDVTPGDLKWEYLYR